MQNENVRTERPNIQIGQVFNCDDGEWEVYRIDWSCDINNWRIVLTQLQVSWVATPEKLKGSLVQ